MRIKYFSDDYPRLERIKKGDWIDLRIDRILEFKDSQSRFHLRYDSKFNELRVSKGDIVKFGLGVAMEIPEGYEALVTPRSSTFKNWGLILTNSLGVIDNSYCGDEDEWQAEFYATKNGVIKRFDRVCQFRIIKNQPEFEFKEVKKLGNQNRGGFGTTGRN